jgi:hypothetical protein
VKLFFGHSLHIEEIRKRIAGLPILTCKYVFTEIRNQSVTLIGMYFKLIGSDTVSDAFALISESFSKRELSLAISLRSKLGTTESKSEALAMTANIIFSYIEASEALVERFIDDGLNCPLAEVKFSTDPELTTAEVFNQFRTRVKCLATEKKKCRQDEVLRNNQRKTARVCADNDSSKSLAAMREMFEELSTGEIEHARGLKTRCSVIGDFLIALQCPKRAKIVSIDKSYIDLGRILEREVDIVPSLRALVAV